MPIEMARFSVPVAASIVGVMAGLGTGAAQERPYPGATYSVTGERAMMCRMDECEVAISYSLKGLTNQPHVPSISLISSSLARMKASSSSLLILEKRTSPNSWRSLNMPSCLPNNSSARTAATPLCSNTSIWQSLPLARQIAAKACGPWQSRRSRPNRRSPAHGRFRFHP
jgi:hypothetical protein